MYRTTVSIVSLITSPELLQGYEFRGLGSQRMNRVINVIIDNYRRIDLVSIYSVRYMHLYTAI